jgi:hypothetical protein
VAREWPLDSAGCSRAHAWRYRGHDAVTVPSCPTRTPSPPAEQRRLSLYHRVLLFERFRGRSVHLRSRSKNRSVLAPHGNRSGLTAMFEPAIQVQEAQLGTSNSGSAERMLTIAPNGQADPNIHQTVG